MLKADRGTREAHISLYENFYKKSLVAVSDFVVIAATLCRGV